MGNTATSATMPSPAIDFESINAELFKEFTYTDMDSERPAMYCGGTACSDGFGRPPRPDDVKIIGN